MRWLWPRTCGGLWAWEVGGGALRESVSPGPPLSLTALPMGSQHWPRGRPLSLLKGMLKAVPEVLGLASFSLASALLGDVSSR